MSNEKLREAFEARMTDNGKWPRAVEQGRNGCYLLAQTENAWAEWQACAEALATTGPDMPLSMNQFGRLVELTREHLSDNTFVYKATSKTGDTCHFGVESAAKAWAKGGTVEAIKVRDFKLHTSSPTTTTEPAVNQQLTTELDEREAFEKWATLPTQQSAVDGLPKPFGYVSDGFADGLRFQHKPWPVEHTLLHSTMPVFSAAAVQQFKQDAERYRWLADGNNYYEAINLISDGSLTEDALGKAIDAAMAKGANQ